MKAAAALMFGSPEGYSASSLGLTRSRPWNVDACTALERFILSEVEG
jgi:hypothetical protein